MVSAVSIYRLNSNNDVCFRIADIDILLKKILKIVFVFQRSLYNMATHRSRPVAFLCLRVNIVKLCLFPSKNKLWFSWCTFAITVRNIYLNYLYCNFVQILVYFITINDIWHLKEADLKPFSVSRVNIVKLDLTF